jgi:type IV secretion system protein VirD4
MATGQRLGIVAAGLAAGLFAATQFIAWAFYWSPALGAGLSLSPDLTLYAPWSVLEWRTRFGAAHRTEFTLALLMIMAGGLAGALGARLVGEGAGPHPNDRRRRRGWGTIGEARKARLLSGEGCVIGAFGNGRTGRLVTTQDLRPTLLTGGTRSGKGRGHVVPTLLNWTGSTLSHDPKGELETITAGWRAGWTAHASTSSPKSIAARTNSAQCSRSSQSSPTPPGATPPTRCGTPGAWRSPSASSCMCSTPRPTRTRTSSPSRR